MSVNPGPSTYPCGNKKCHTTVAKNHRPVLCESCFYWWHIKCADITPNEYHLLSNSEDPWLCKTCLTFQFSDSFFEDQPIPYNGDSSVNSDEIKSVRKNHINKFMVSHLNINSLKSKFVEIHELLNDKIVDLFFPSETKLNSTFRDNILTYTGIKWKDVTGMYMGEVLIPLLDQTYQPEEEQILKQ